MARTPTGLTEPSHAAAVAAELGRPRWRGERGRIEVWYATFSASDGTGYWVHHETVAPTALDGAPYGHGWAAVFPSDAAPVVARFGPEPVAPGPEGAWFRAGGVEFAPGRMIGAAGPLLWDLSFADSDPPLYTFGRALWQRELLPGAQIVPWPRARVQGTVCLGAFEHAIDTSAGIARIYGHGNAERWCWLHADLGDGGVLELVSAVPRRAGFRRLPPRAMVQLRQPGEPDWPASPILGAARFATRIESMRFTIAGTVGRRRLQVEVTLPVERCVTLEYRDPDGATATCTNTERAHAAIVVEDPHGAGSRRWTLAGTAHAEIGSRP